LEAMVISFVFNINFVMKEIGENDDNDDNAAQLPKWTNLLCPSCAIYYGIQSLISGIKKKRKTAVIKSK